MPRRPAPQSDHPDLPELESLATRYEDLIRRAEALRGERDALIQRLGRDGVPTVQIAVAAQVTKKTVNQVLARADIPAKERIESAVHRFFELDPPMATTFSALGKAVGVDTARAVASSVKFNEAISGAQGGRILPRSWFDQEAGGYVIPSDEPAWLTQDAVPRTRLELLTEAGLAREEQVGGRTVHVVPLDRVVRDPDELRALVGATA